MARAYYMKKRDQQLYVSLLSECAAFCSEQRIGKLKTLRRNLLHIQRMVEAAPMAYARETGASDKLAHAIGNVRSLAISIDMAIDAFEGAQSDINDALKISEKAEQEDEDKRKEEETKERKKEYAHEYYLKKKQEAKK